MKKNIFTAITAFMIAIVLFFNLSSTKNNASATTLLVIESSISENYIAPKEQEIIATGLLYTNILDTQIDNPEEETEECAVGTTESAPSLAEPKTEFEIVEETTWEEETTYEEETTWEEETTSTYSSQYPVASYIWSYMRSLGWSNAVCAGIMGNIMAEVGGNTLDLDPYLYYYDSGTYYGICQWYVPYYPEISGSSLEYQCYFLESTIAEEINVFGYKYSSSMNYTRFLNLTDPSEVALCFAKCYERCASFSYGVRQSNAEKAYTYFVG